MTEDNSTRSYYPALDGLRGVAILMVVLLHNFGFMSYFFFGWLGVDLFFVLSGFLITNILLKTVGKPHFLRNFYMRRVLRIFPLFYLMLVICFFILPQFKGLDLDLSYYINHQAWFWAYLQNWLFVFHEPYGSKMLLHTWSLGVEEQFYLVWPVTIMLVKKPKILLGLTIALLILVGTARYILWTYQVEDLAYSSLYTFTRIDGLCIGSMLALLMTVNPSFLKKYTVFIVLLMAAINFVFYFLNGHQSFTLPYLAVVGYTTFCVLFGILVHEAITGQSKLIQLLLNNRFLKFFGRISYGLYVYHWPVYMLLFKVIYDSIHDRFTSRSSLAEAGSSIAVTIIAIAISVISYRYFERPFLRLKNRYA